MPATATMEAPATTGQAPNFSGLAPSAGAEFSTGTAAAASPTASAAQLTDEQILGITEDVPAFPLGGKPFARPGTESEDLGTGAGENADETQPLAPEGAEGKPNEAARVSGQMQRKLTPEVREFLKTHPEIRDAYYRAQEYQRLFPDFKTAEVVASHLAQYENPAELAEDLRGVADLRAIDRMFYSGDPAEHGRIVENLFTGDPQAFSMLVETLPETLRRLAADTARPELARRAAQVYAESDLRAFERVLEQQYRKARAEGNEELARELERVGGAVRGRAPWAPERMEEKLARIEAERLRLEEQKRQTRAEATARWVGDANEQVVREFTDAVRGTVEQLVGKTYPEEAKRLLVGEIYRRVHQNLERNQELVDHVGALLRGGAGDPRTQRQMVRLVTNQAKRMIPDVAERVIGAFGQGTLAATEQKQRRESAAAGRVDVTGAAGMGARSMKAPNPGQLQRTGKYRQLSDDDILEGRV